MRQKYSQTIFLTDDIRANRDYVKHVFESFPLGVVWSSLDFVVYLFTKHRNRIPLDQAINTLRDINAQDGLLEVGKSASRLTEYRSKLNYIDKVLS